MNKSDDRAIERIECGVAGLDRILNGGFIKGGIYIIQGPPGAGKTILANQLCFHEVAKGGTAAYVTLLAESHARMLMNLSALDFFDAGVIPQSLFYLSAFSSLEGEGLKGLLELVRREVRGHGSSVLIIDGLVAAEETARDDREFKKFIHELQTQISLSGCTTFLLTSGGGRQMRPERTMVDGLVEMRDELHGIHRERFVEVTKFRGSSSLRGPHAYQISDAGITVYPRVESLLRYPLPRDEAEPSRGRLTSGVPTLDKMLKGGLPSGSTTMISGPSGAGKTSFGLHFLATCSEQERGVYLSFYEGQNLAFEKAANLGLDLKKRSGSALEFLWYPTTEHSLDEIGHALLHAASRKNVRRVFIDGLDGLRQMSTDPQRVVRFATALVNEFRERGICTLYTLETHRTLSPYLEAPPVGISTILENWVALRFSALEPQLLRAISVVKVRDSDFDPSTHEFIISDAGIRIGPVTRDPQSFPDPRLQGAV